MTIIERLELIRAGYKRAEIDAMIKADEDAAKAPPEEKPKEEPKKDEPKKPPEQPKEQPKDEPKKPPEQPKEQPKDELAEVDALKVELAELKKQMQLQNIQKIGLDTPPQKSVEEVLAEAVFGNPETK